MGHGVLLFTFRLEISSLKIRIGQRPGWTRTWHLGSSRFHAGTPKADSNLLLLMEEIWLTRLIVSLISYTNFMCPRWYKISSMKNIGFLSCLPHGSKPNIWLPYADLGGVEPPEECASCQRHQRRRPTHKATGPIECQTKGRQNPWLRAYPSMPSSCLIFALLVSFFLKAPSPLATP